MHLHNDLLLTALWFYRLITVYTDLFCC